MSHYPLSASHVEQAKLLPDVLRRLATCTREGSLERAELVARLTKLLERFDEDAGSTLDAEDGRQ